MNKYKLLILLINASFVFSDYNSALEIEQNNYSLFNGYKFEYSKNTNDTAKWTKLKLTCNDTDGNYNYLAAGLKINSDNQNVYIKMKNINAKKVSDIYCFKASPKMTTFLKMDLDLTETANNTINISTNLHIGLLPYYYIPFRIKAYKPLIIEAFLNEPLPHNFFDVRDLINFTWNISGPCVYSFLVIRFSTGEIMNKINVTGMEEHTLVVSNAFLLPGVYSWQIVVEDEENNEYGSEIRPFYIINENDQLDSDNDGFLDVEEIARFSNPFDKYDFPLNITSTNKLPDAVKNLQYFIKLETNSKKRCRWDLSGDLPQGLILTDDGIIQGRTVEVGTFQFTVEAEDISGKTDEKRMLLKVIDASPAEIETGRGYIQ